MKAYVLLMLTAAGTAAADVLREEFPTQKVPVLCRVVQQVYHDGWQVCGAITVWADGTYCRVEYDLWKEKPLAKAFRGTLPGKLRDLLAESSLRPDLFRSSDGVPVYEYGIDNAKVRHPESVTRLLRFVN